MMEKGRVVERSSISDSYELASELRWTAHTFVFGLSDSSVINKAAILFTPGFHRHMLIQDGS